MGAQAIEPREVERLYGLGKILGIGRPACDLLVAEHIQQNEGDSHGDQ